LRVAVCIVMVPRFEAVFVHRTTGELRATPAIMNPADENALEMAVSIKDSQGAEVVAVTCGGEQSEGILRKAVAMGCDHAYHLIDIRFANSDPLATAGIIGEALKKIKADIVFSGSEALNGGQTGPRVAEVLGYRHYIDAKRVDLGDTPKVTRTRDGKEETLHLGMPAVITVVAGSNTPRMPKAVQIMKAHREGALTRWGIQDLGLDESMVGVKGSSTRVVEMF